MKLFLVIVILTIGHCSPSPKSYTQVQQKPIFIEPNLSTKNPSNTNWKYSKSIDPMTGMENKFAVIRSENSLNLQFPYQGENYGILTVRKMGENPNETIFSIYKGQFLCYSFNPCKIIIRINEDEAKYFTGSGTNDPGTTNITFIDESEELINLMKQAITIRVSIVVFGNGNQILEFKTKTGLE